MSITINDTQLKAIKDLVELTPRQIADGKTPDYAGMYNYIYTEFGQQMKDSGSKEQSHWFEEAAKINSYLNAVATPESERTLDQQDLVDNPSQSAYFIQQINKESLGLDS